MGKNNSEVKNYDVLINAATKEAERKGALGKFTEAVGKVMAGVGSIVGVEKVVELVLDCIHDDAVNDITVNAEALPKGALLEDFLWAVGGAALAGVGFALWDKGIRLKKEENQIKEARDRMKDKRASALREGKSQESNEGKEEYQPPEYKPYEIKDSAEEQISIEKQPIVPKIDVTKVGASNCFNINTNGNNTSQDVDNQADIKPAGIEQAGIEQAGNLEEEKKFFSTWRPISEGSGQSFEE